MELPNIEVLEKVKERLNRLIPLHKNESSVSGKTWELLNITSNLLKEKEKDLFIPIKTFEAPSYNDYMEYGVVFIIILLLIVLIMKMQRRERRINEEIIEGLKRAIEAKVRELK